jgi:hypothetical protein
MSVFTSLRQSAFTRISIITVLLLIALLASLFYYLTYNEVAANNRAMEITAELTAQSVVDKVDRNFYERFGDVQAFAYNRLAVQTAEKDSVAEGTQEFINTMTSYYVLYDLMMIVGRNGTVLAVNTKDKNGKDIGSSFLVRQNFAGSEWFKACTSGEGPKGGAWFSDFMKDENVARIYQTTGSGMAYAAPIRDSNGGVIGVWYNYASWKEVTEGIREEAENNLMKDHPGAFALLTKHNGEVISAQDEKLLGIIIHSDSTGIKQLEGVDLGKFSVGQGKSHGAYTYAGKQWKAFTLIPSTAVSWSIFFSPKNLTAVLMLLFAMGGIGFFVFRFFNKNIVSRLNSMKYIQQKLSEGEFVPINSRDVTKDEIGQMMQSLVNLTSSLQGKAAFADEIAKGNLKAQLENIDPDDVLGNSLLNMRNQLEVNIESEKRRNWATEGLAQIGTILRSYKSLDELYSNVIGFAVKYTNANQGAMFLLDDDSGDQDLIMVSCYAYNKKKYIDKKVHVGQGLIGQAVMEKDTIYITDIPADYVHITSGLGEATPRSIIIIPLKTNDHVLGAMEIASFEKFEKHEIEFLEKLAESIAASVGSIRTNERTREMVSQLQQQTEQMRSQEEEMRQNMEELSATQEEMIRKEQEYISRIRSLETVNTAEERNFN